MSATDSVTLEEATADDAAKRSRTWTPAMRARQREQNLGEKNPMYGKTHSIETRQKLRTASIRQWADPIARQFARQRNLGRRNPNHQGKKQPCPASQQRSNTSFKKESILERDNHRCVLCGATEHLQLDHIDGNPRNQHNQNLRILCNVCNTREAAARRKRLQGTPYAGGKVCCHTCNRYMPWEESITHPQTELAVCPTCGYKVRANPRNYKKGT